MARPARDHERKRVRILELSRELIAERGVESFALADVADAAGVTPPAIYHYFRDRDALLREALRAEVDDVVAAVVDTDEEPAAPLVRLQRFFERQAGLLASHRPGATAFLLSALIAGRADPETWPVVSGALGAAERFFREVVTEAERRGELAAGTDVDEAVDFLRAGLAGMFLIRALDVAFDPHAAAARMVVALRR